MIKSIIYNAIAVTLLAASFIVINILYHPESNSASAKSRNLILVIISISGGFLIYSTIHIYKEQARRKALEAERERTTSEAELQLKRTLREVSDYKYALDESSIVAITDQKGIIKHANENFCRISKYSIEELIGHDHRIINSGFHTKSFIRDLWTTIANGKIWRGELKNRAKDGTVYWVDTTIVPFLNDSGKPYQYVAIRADITERKKAEANLLNAQRDITELNRGLEEKIRNRTEQLRKTNEELEAFSYSVSHDLRAPLRGIIGFTTILEEDYGDKLDEEGRRITDVIKSNTLKMGRLIDDLLAFSKTGKQEILKTRIDMSSLAESIKEEQKAQHRAANIIEWNIMPLPPVHADMNTIRQVWINLISNAVKYTSKKDQAFIEIGYQIMEEENVYFVKDNGVGFDENYKHKLFRVFQRLHDADEFEGTGVGLALVAKIISRHGGRVWAEGKEDEGACFYFSLPSNENKLN